MKNHITSNPPRPGAGTWEFLTRTLAMAGLLAALLLPARLHSQTEPSALVEFQSTDKGFLLPRMTQAQRDAIAGPAKGLMVYNTTTGCLETNHGSPSLPLWQAVNCFGSIDALNCAASSRAGILAVGQPAAGVMFSVQYTGGNGGSHNGQTVTSAGVEGLTATLPKGRFASGSGSLIYKVTGIPAGGGTASFALDIGGQACTLAMTVPGVIGALDCGGAVITGSLASGQPATGVSATLPYTGGSGGPHSGQVVSSTGVVGLTATLVPGSFANGSGNLLYTITGTPATGGTASFALSIGGQACVLVITVPGVIGSLNCGGAVITGNLVPGQSAAAVSASVPYTGGNGGPHAGQAVNSTGVTGLTATLAAGSFANGIGSLVYDITGTPAGGGTASFALNIGGQACTLAVTVPGIISALDCGAAVFTGILLSSQAAAGVSASVPYTGGSGGPHNGQVVGSTGVAGLTATLPAGSFANGGGNLAYTITGTPAASGTASFALGIGGQACTLSVSVLGSVGALNCGGAVITGNLVPGQSAVGVSASVPYTGGNVGPHNGQVVSSTGVTGLTATLAAGNFANGTGSLVYDITGTPAGGGTASFALNIGGKACTLAVTVPGIISALNCGGALVTGNLASGQSATGVSASVPYTGGSGGPHNGQVVNSTGVAGLTATLAPGSFANGAGNLLYTITGTPATGGTASFALSIGGQACSLAITVPGVIGVLNCGSAVITGNLVPGQSAAGVSASVPYTGGNGGPHAGQAVNSTGVTGLTATLAAGNFANGAGNLVYTITGTPSGGGAASFALAIGGQACTLRVNLCGAFVAAGQWKRFMCHNLAAANTNADPYVPSWEISGGYWQWGQKGPDPSVWLNTNSSNYAHGPVGPGGGEANALSIPGWLFLTAPNGAWSDGSKTTNDPCPMGFRVPTKAQWAGVIANNTQSVTGTWAVNTTNYSSARFFGSGMMLMAAGYRDYVVGVLVSRGNTGSYWSSTENGTSYAWYLGFDSGAATNPESYRANGLSLRCVAE